MYITFAVNATAIMLVVSMVEGSRFLDLFRLPLSLNVVHWLGNMALGILGAILWTAEPVALVLMIAPVALTFTTYRRWVESIHERDQMRDLYEAGRALSAPLASSDDFGGFLGLLEKLLAADRVELVVVDGSSVAVHASAGVRYLTVDEAETAPLEAFVAVHSGVAPQIALVGDEGDVRGVLAVYRPAVLTASERLLLDGLANQIAARLQDHRLFGKTLERARLSEIVSHTSDGVFTVDTLGRITTWNPAMEALTGYTEDEALGRRCYDLLDLARDTIFSDGAAGDGESRDTEIRTGDGTKKDVRLRTSVIRDDEEAPPARIAVVRDASEETRAEQIKRDFVSMVSHELRTPLTPLKGFLMSLVEGTVEDSPERRQEYYRIMLRQAQRLERTVSDMLDASQIEAGGLVIDLQPVPLDHVLGRLVKDFQEQHPGRRVAMGEIGRPAIVLADPFRVEQVVLNLLSNADKYTAPDLPITVGAIRDGRHVTISVWDKGQGIAPEHLDQIFDRFYRVKDESGQRLPGTGLGLYIARTLVEAMSGHIWVESELGSARRSRSTSRSSRSLPSGRRSRSTSPRPRPWIRAWSAADRGRGLHIPADAVGRPGRLRSQPRHPRMGYPSPPDAVPQGGIMRIRNIALTGLAAAAVAYYFDPVKGSARRSRLRGQVMALTGKAMRRTDRRRSPRTWRPHRCPNPRSSSKAPEVRPSETNALPEDEGDAAIARRIRTRLEERSDLETGGLVIDVVRGVAYLRGELHDRQKYDEVIDLTGSVPGIRRVQSLLHLPESQSIGHTESRVISRPATRHLGDTWNG